jgi:hypothetical protein
MLALTGWAKHHLPCSRMDQSPQAAAAMPLSTNATGARFGVSRPNHPALPSYATSHYSPRITAPGH